MVTTKICTTYFLGKIIKETDNVDNLLLLNHHLIKKTLTGIEKLNSRQIYSLLKNNYLQHFVNVFFKNIY